MSSKLETLTPEQKSVWRGVVRGYGEPEGPGPRSTTPAQRAWFEAQVAQLILDHWPSILVGDDGAFRAQVDACAAPSSWPTHFVIPVPTWTVEDPGDAEGIKERPLLAQPVPRAYWRAARRAVPEMNFDGCGFKFVAGKVLGLKWAQLVHARKTGRRSATRFLRFDYEAWATNALEDRRLNCDGLMTISYFRESIWVESETLLNYKGDGAIGHTEFENTAEEVVSLSGPAVPPVVRRNLCALLRDHETEVRDYFNEYDENPMPDDLHPDIQRTLRSILAKS